MIVLVNIGRRRSIKVMPIKLIPCELAPEAHRAIRWYNNVSILIMLQQGVFHWPHLQSCERPHVWLFHYLFLQIQIFKSEFSESRSLIQSVIQHQFHHRLDGLNVLSVRQHLQLFSSKIRFVVSFAIELMHQLQKLLVMIFKILKMLFVFNLPFKVLQLLCQLH